MLNKIFEDERVCQIHIADDKRVFWNYNNASGCHIRVESSLPSFKGLLEDEEGDYTIKGMVREFQVHGDNLDDALNRVYERLQEV